MAVEIVDPATGELVDACSGPGDSGSCPHVAPSGSLPCSGLVVQLPVGPRGRLLRLRVREDAEVCPLRALELLS